MGREAALAADLAFAVPASKRSSAGFALAFDFSGLGIVFHVMAGSRAGRIGCPDYATVGREK
jgi:hypothetical protein